MGYIMPGEKGIPEECVRTVGEKPQKKASGACAVPSSLTEVLETDPIPLLQIQPW